MCINFNICLYLSIYLSVCLSACLPACLSACLSVCLSLCLSVCLSACLPVCLSLSLSIYLSTYLSTYLSMYLSIEIFLSMMFLSVSVFGGLLYVYCVNACLFRYVFVFLCIPRCSVCSLVDLCTISFCTPLNLFHGYSKFQYFKGTTISIS